MTPEQALQILSRAASLAPMTAQDHMACHKAVEVLTGAIKPKEEKKKG